LVFNKKLLCIGKNIFMAGIITIKVKIAPIKINKVLVITKGQNNFLVCPCINMKGKNYNATKALNIGNPTSLNEFFSAKNVKILFELL
jgi:hypothetical protein